MSTPFPRAYWPTAHWQAISPEETGMDGTRLEQMRVHIHKQIPGLLSLLIVRHGYLVFEEYYHGFHQNSYFSISSATKSVVSMLIGLALDRGMLTSLDQPVLDFFLEYAVSEQDPRKRALTLRHLLSLQTGFSREIPDEYWRNPVELALKRPMERPPGEQFFYDSQGVDILAGILTRVTGKSAAAFADTTLFQTLGIWREAAARFTWQRDPTGAHQWHGDAFWDEQNGYLWKVDPQGNSTGSFGAHFTAREMAKLGYLYLNQGQWDGQQIISADYVADSTCKHSEGGWPLSVPYGYLWWITQHKSYDAFFASGFGSKLIYVIPALDIVIVTTASVETARNNPQQEQDIRDLMPHFILPAITT